VTMPNLTDVSNRLRETTGPGTDRSNRSLISPMAMGQALTKQSDPPEESRYCVALIQGRPRRRDATPPEHGNGAATPARDQHSGFRGPGVGQGLTSQEDQGRHFDSIDSAHTAAAASTCEWAMAPLCR
jgi:hypothetical protein